VSADEFTVTVRREIAAPAETLFDAWLDAESLGTWARPRVVSETRAATDHRDSVVTVTFEPLGSCSTMVELHQVGRWLLAKAG